MLTLLDALDVPYWVVATNAEVADQRTLHLMSLSPKSHQAWTSMIAKRPTIEPCEGGWKANSLYLDELQGFRFRGLIRVDRLIIMRSRNLSFPDLLEAKLLTIRRASEQIEFPILTHVHEIHDGRFASVSAPDLDLSGVRVTPCGDGTSSDWIPTREKGLVLLDEQFRLKYQTLAVGADPSVIPY